MKVELKRNEQKLETGTKHFENGGRDYESKNESSLQRPGNEEGGRSSETSGERRPCLDTAPSPVEAKA